MIVVASAARFEVSTMLKLFDSKGLEYTYLEVGVGAIRACKQAEAMKGLVVNRSVLFVGTCGSSDSNDVGQVVTSDVCRWNPISVDLQNSYLIPGVEEPVSLDPLVNDGLPIVEITCSSAISKILVENRPAKRFENIELYSVATCWRPLTRNFFTLLGVTNHIGPSSHEQWVRMHRTVADKTAECAIIPEMISQIFRSLNSHE